MAKKRDKGASTNKTVLDPKAIRKAARAAAKEAIAAETKAIIDLVEADALAAAAKAEPVKQDARPESSALAAKAKAKAKAKTPKGSKRGSGADLGDTHMHGRVEDDEVRAEFSRLVGEIAGLVQLVEQHRPEVRRAVFDSYVTAVIEFGATAKDLGFVDLRDNLLEDDGDLVEAVVVIPATGDALAGSGGSTDTGVLSFSDDALDDDDNATPRSRRRSFETSSVKRSATGPVREADGLEREITAPRPARSSVHRARSGMASIEPDASAAAATNAVAEGGAGATDARTATDAPAATPRIRRRRSASQSVPTLEALAAAEPPHNNDQRNHLIVQSHELAGTPATLEAIEAGYERMGWRVPVNLGTSLRQSVRKGLVLLGDDDGYRSA